MKQATAQFSQHTIASFLNEWSHVVGTVEHGLVPLALSRLQTVLADGASVQRHREYTQGRRTERGPLHSLFAAEVTPQPRDAFGRFAAYPLCCGKRPFDKLKVWLLCHSSYCEQQAKSL